MLGGKRWGAVRSLGGNIRRDIRFLNRFAVAESAKFYGILTEGRDRVGGFVGASSGGAVRLGTKFICVCCMILVR